MDEYVRHLSRVLDRMRGLEDGSDDPSPSTGYCSEKTCQYYQECRDWKYGEVE